MKTTTVEWYTTQEKMPTDKSDVMFVMENGKTHCGYFYIACGIPHFCYVEPVLCIPDFM